MICLIPFCRSCTWLWTLCLALRAALVMICGPCWSCDSEPRQLGGRAPHRAGTEGFTKKGGPGSARTDASGRRGLWSAFFSVLSLSVLFLLFLTAQHGTYNVQQGSRPALRWRRQDAEGGRAPATVNSSARWGGGPWQTYTPCGRPGLWDGQEARCAPSRSLCRQLCRQL